ncbi:MFS transporter [Brevibacterium permense]|uniref:MFS transporter n=1 Tax=Brevibacterium permense TaxID=234834 RepID=UPI0021CF33C3|nr:MFS transporter [Brevibacterium permense]MCU4295861.1 MFS transporter [Brevibacterium permense]
MTLTDEKQKTKTVWKTALAGGAGSLLEYYDYSLYAALAVFISSELMPASDPQVALLATLAVFGTGFFMRPLGALYFGWLGDRHGRKTALLSSVIIMGLASALVGLLPSYESMGIIVPIALVALRLLQGLCAGGEASGASTYVAESSPPRLRGFFVAFTPAGIALGTAAATGMASLVSFTFGESAMTEWGWRVPFLLSLPLSLLILWVRRTLPESAKFAAPKEKTPAPIVSVFKHERPAVVKLVLLSFSMTLTGYVGHVYLNTYLTEELGYSTSEAFGTNSIITIVFAVLMPFAALFSDRLGRRRTYALAMIAYVLLTIPSFALMDPAEGVPLALTMAISFIPWVFAQAIGYPLFTELFSSTARLTGVAFGFSIGTIAGGGFGPYVAQWLTNLTGWVLAPAAYMTIAAIIGLVTVLTVGRSKIDVE